MAMKIILESEGEKQVEIALDPSEYDDKDWEKVCDEIGNNVSRELAIRWLGIIEDRLFHAHPRELKVEGFRDRRRATPFGKFTISRRLYSDKNDDNKDSKYHFLLDEHLNWVSYVRATPDMTQSLVSSCTRSPFREVTREHSSCGLSWSTIHSLLQSVAESAIQGEKQEHSACFGEGSLSPPGRGKSPILYTEADGIYIRLQREKDRNGKRRKHYELKSCIAYEGWERLPQRQERYRLVNKKVYCHGDDSIPFWDGAGLMLHRYWDLSYTKLIVLGGDDANWINDGMGAMGFCVRQLDGFHIARYCRRGWKEGKVVYDTLRSGVVISGELHEREGKTAQQSRDYISRHKTEGVDWRVKVGADSPIPEDARGLGAMEGNESHLFGDRMKDRGMSWTIKGAQHMGKAIQLVASGELGKWCGNNPPESGRQKLSFDVFDSQHTTHTVRGSLPALNGPHASRPWAKAIRQLTQIRLL
jgi:hypothetical protein